LAVKSELEWELKQKTEVGYPAPDGSENRIQKSKIRNQKTEIGYPAPDGSEYTSPNQTIQN